MVWSKLIFIIIFITLNLRANELSDQEIDYFKIIDLNNDGLVSLDEIHQSMNIILRATRK